VQWLISRLGLSNQVFPATKLLGQKSKFTYKLFIRDNKRTLLGAPGGRPQLFLRYSKLKTNISYRITSIYTGFFFHDFRWTLWALNLQHREIFAYSKGLFFSRGKGCGEVERLLLNGYKTDKVFHETFYFSVLAKREMHSLLLTDLLSTYIY